MNRLNYRFTIILLLITSSVDPLLARTFKDRSGKEFEAKIMSVSGDTVNLLIPGKTKIYKVPISKLSDTDQDYIKNLKNNRDSIETSKTAGKTDVTNKKTVELQTSQ